MKRIELLKCPKGYPEIPPSYLEAVSKINELIEAHNSQLEGEGDDKTKVLTNVELLNSMSGDVWAKEFMRCYNESVMKQNHLWIDLDLMRTWFCSAIMAGHDITLRRQEKKAQGLVSALEYVLSEEQPERIKKVVRDALQNYKRGGV